MSKTINQWSRSELLALPERKWNEAKTYDSLLVVPRGKKHESGYGTMAVIGCRDMEPVEVAVPSCDDLGWIKSQLWDRPDAPMRVDCALKSRALHFWSRSFQFFVGYALSSTDINLLAKP